MHKNSGGFLKAGRFTKSWCFSNNQADFKIQADFQNKGTAESPAVDFLLVWLKSSRSDPRRCDESLMQSPSEETAQAATLSRTVPAVCTGPPCQEMAKIHAATKSQAAAWNFTNSCQITKS